MKTMNISLEKHTHNIQTNFIVISVSLTETYPWTMDLVQMLKSIICFSIYLFVYYLCTYLYIYHLFIYYLSPHSSINLFIK